MPSGLDETERPSHSSCEPPELLPSPRTSYQSDCPLRPRLEHPSWLHQAMAARSALAGARRRPPPPTGSSTQSPITRPPPPGPSPEPRPRTPDILAEGSLARLMVNEPATLSFETASRLVGRAAYRSGGASMRQAISEARDAERRARKLALQEQASKGVEREALSQQRDEHEAQQEEASIQLVAQLARHAAFISLRCEHGLPRPEARECREQLEAMRHVVADRLQDVAREELEHEKRCTAVQQVSFERECRLVRLASDESVAAAGIIMRQRLQRARVTARVMLAAARWRDRARVTKLRHALREAVRRLRMSESKVVELHNEQKEAALAAARAPVEKTLSHAGGRGSRVGAASEESSLELGPTALLKQALAKSEKGRQAAEEALLHKTIEVQQRAADADAANTDKETTEHLLREALAAHRASDADLAEASAEGEKLRGALQIAEHRVSQLEAEAEANQQLLQQAMAQSRSGGKGMSAAEAERAKQAKLEMLEMKHEVAQAHKLRANLNSELTRVTAELSATQHEVIEQREQMRALRTQLEQLEHARAVGGSEGGSAEGDTPTAPPSSASAPPPSASPTHRQPPTLPAAPPTDTLIELSYTEAPAAAPVSAEPAAAVGGGANVVRALSHAASESPAIEEELQSLRQQVRLLRGQAARAELNERDKQESAALMRQLESSLQAKSREVANLSFALQAAYVAAKEKRVQQPSGPVKVFGMAHKKRSSSSSSATGGGASDGARGYELVQVLSEAPPPKPKPKPYQTSSTEEDPLAVLDRSAMPGAATAKEMVAIGGDDRNGANGSSKGASGGGWPARMPSTLVRFRGKVYALREVQSKGGPLSTADLSQRVHTFMLARGRTPPPQATHQAHISQPQQQQPWRPPPHRPASAHTRLAAEAAMLRLSSVTPDSALRGGVGEGAAVHVHVPDARLQNRNDRPQSAHAALHSPREEQTAANGVDTGNRSVVLAVGLQQANSIRYRSSPPLPHGSQ